MNPLGCHALVWAGDWSEASARYAIESTARVGFDLIEVAILDPETVDTAMTKSLLENNGLGAACSLGLDDTADVSSEDPAVVARGQDRLAAAVDVAHRIGAATWSACSTRSSASTAGRSPRPAARTWWNRCHGSPSRPPMPASPCPSRW